MWWPPSETPVLMLSLKNQAYYGLLVAKIYYFCITNLGAENHAANLRFAKTNIKVMKSYLTPNKLLREVYVSPDVTFLTFN